MTVAEEKMLEDLELSYNKYWVPVNWCVTLTNQASAKGYTSSPPGLVHLIQVCLCVGLSDFLLIISRRSKTSEMVWLLCATMTGAQSLLPIHRYLFEDILNVKMFFFSLQVVFFAVRVYFIFCLISRQYIRVPVSLRRCLRKDSESSLKYF